MSVRREIDILAALLDDPPDLSVLREESAWQIIRQDAARFGVAPLIAHGLRRDASLEDRKWCDRILVDSWIRYSRMLGELESLAGLFESENIPVIALKGPLLAQRYYDPPFLRKPSMDLDIGVRMADVERASAALVKAGYTLYEPIVRAKAISHHVVLDHPSRPRVELHFRLSHMALGIPLDEFFDRASVVALPSGRIVKVLAAPDQLLHLVLHLTQSRFGTLFHLAEIRRLCKAEPESVRMEAAARAAFWRYSGAFRMMDVAFGARWHEPFLPAAAQLPKTWLQGRLTPALYSKFEAWSLPGRKLNLATRLYGRWLDLQMTDAVSDALRWARFFLSTAQGNFASWHAWGTVKRLRFANAVPDAHSPGTKPETGSSAQERSPTAQDDFSLTGRGR